MPRPPEIGKIIEEFIEVKMKDYAFLIKKEHKILELIASRKCLALDVCNKQEETIKKCLVCIVKDVLLQKDNIFSEVVCAECGYSDFTIEKDLDCDRCGAHLIIV